MSSKTDLQIEFEKLLDSMRVNISARMNLGEISKNDSDFLRTSLDYVSEAYHDTNRPALDSWSSSGCSFGPSDDGWYSSSC